MTEPIHIHNYNESNRCRECGKLLVIEPPEIIKPVTPAQPKNDNIRILLEFKRGVDELFARALGEMTKEAK